MADFVKDVRSFEKWKFQVEQELEKLCGMSSEDLPDCDYYVMFENYVSPRSAAKRAIRLAKGY